MNKKLLREQKLLRQQELVTKAKAEARDLDGTEQAEFDSLQREIENLTNDIEKDETAERDLETSNAAERATNAERIRISEITALCRDFDVDATEYISSGATVEAVRAAVLESLRSTKAPVGSHAELVDSAEDKFRAAAVDALLMRNGINVEKPADGARDLAGISLQSLAIESLARQGVHGMNLKSPDAVFAKVMERQFYNPTAAFPAILDAAIEKAYKEGHKTVPVTFDQWTKKGSLRDFKTHDNFYVSGPAAEFLEVPEGGELKHSTFTDEKLPTRKLKTYGRQFTLTRQAFINDDIDLITRIPAKFAASARKTINKQVYSILVNNPAIYDGTALFSASHSNLLASGTGITKEAVQGMILALQNQQDQFGEACIIRPATIIVPSGYAFDMYTLFFSPTISTEGNTQAVNPLYRYKDTITVVEDPTINVLCGGIGNVMPWWLLGDKADTDFIEVDYLNGQEVPTIERKEAAGQLGFTWDIYLDWGVSVMDYRGAIKNPGIKVENPIEVATN